MKVFRDLYIHATQQESKALVECMTKSVSPPWRRDKVAEERQRVRSLGEEELYYFTRDGDTRQPATLLALMRRDDRTLYVPNIVPREIGQLSLDEYNAILLEFVDSVLKAAKLEDTQFDLTPDEKSIDEWLSPETLKKLRSFSGLANKSTGSSHWMDQSRWFTFLVAANGEAKRLPVHMLKQWLMEEEGWGEVTASSLGSEYQFAMDLLDHLHGVRR